MTYGGRIKRSFNEQDVARARRVRQEAAAYQREIDNDVAVVMRALLPEKAEEQRNGE